MKVFARLLYALSYVALAASPTGNSVMAAEVKRVESADSGIDEEWVRITPDEDVLGVSATRPKSRQHWEVFIAVAEFIRTEPLESKLRHAVSKALRETPGVAEVLHQDREVWIITGEVSGEQLVRSCSTALDALKDELQSAYDALAEAA